MLLFYFIYEKICFVGKAFLDPRMFFLRSTPKLFNCHNLPSKLLIFRRNFARVKEITVYLIESNGSKHKLKGEVDNKCTIFDMVHDNIDMPSYGVCGGMPACTTCHVIFHPEDFKKFSQPLDKLEEELLENTYEATPTSRLGCQVILEKFMDGMEIRLPSKTVDYRTKEN